MNKVILMGRLTRDPDVKYTQQQMCAARFTLAVDEELAKFITSMDFDCADYCDSFELGLCF